MSMIPPVNANAHSSVEIDDSCNDCCSCCWPRRVKKDPRRPQVNQSSMNLPSTAIKVHSVSQPTLTQSAENEWEITIDGVPQAKE